MFDSLVDVVSGSPWTYALIFGIAALDAFFPLVPSETTVITAGVLAASGDLLIVLVIAAAAAGAVLGDNISYGIGRFAGEPATRRLLASEKGQRRLEWARHQLDVRGGYLIVVARFIPGGRTAITLASGLLEYAWARFLAYDVLAGVLWGSFAGLLGYLGGRSFEERPWLGLLVAFAVAAAITLGVEAARRVVGARRQAA